MTNLTETTNDAPKTVKFQFRVDDLFEQRLIEVIRAERDIPTKAEMLRRLVDRAYGQIEGGSLPLRVSVQDSASAHVQDRKHSGSDNSTATP